MDSTKKRIKWIDALRFIGMFSVYLSHLGTQAGYFYPFCFRYQVSLFFFVSGAMEAISTKDLSLFESIRRKFKELVLPYFFFAFISILIIIFSGNATFETLAKTSYQYLLGIRNRLFAPILWFLPALFVIHVIFSSLKKLLKNRWFILLLGLALLVISETLLPHRPIVDPSWPWNVDSVMYYFFYFALGYALFPYIRQLLSSSSKLAHFGVIFSGLLVAVYAVVFLLGKDLIAVLFNRVPNSGPVGLVLSEITLIWFCIILSQIISNIELFQLIGRNTLFLTGSEQIIRHLTPPLLSLLGLNLNISSPLSAMVFTFIALIVAVYLIVPFLKTFYENIVKFFTVKAKEKVEA